MKGKSEKAEENLFPDMYVHESEILFPSDERAGMDAKSGQSEIGEPGSHFGKMPRQVVELVVKDEGYDIESRRDNRRIETS